MKLLKLEIWHFRGIEHRIIEPNGESLNIYGENGITKTSTASAERWLLTDKDIYDRSTQSFSIKPREVLPDGSLGEEIIGKEPIVEGTYRLLDGRVKTFKKKHAEDWTTKRGRSEEVLDGYRTECWIDGAVRDVTPYKEEVAEIISDQLMKMLSNPLYLPEVMKKKERRDLLLNLISLSDEDVIDVDPDLSGYPELIGDRNKEDVESALKERKDEITPLLGSKKKKGEIQIRIEENQSEIVDLDQPAESAQESIDILKENIQAKREKLSEAQSGGGVSELKVKIQDIEADKAKARNEHQKQVEESLADARKKVDDIQGRYDQVDGEVRDIRREYKNKEADLQSAHQVVVQMETDIEKERDRSPEPKPTNEGPKVCPMCDQKIPQKDESEHEDHYEKYLEEFNAKKAETVKSLQSDLVLLQEKAHQAGKSLDEVKERGLKANGRLTQVQQALEKAKADLQAKKKEAPEFSTEEFDQKQKVLQDKIEEIRLSKQSLIDEIQNEITDLEAHIEEHHKVIRKHQANKEKRAKIEKYREQIKSLGKELNEIEQSLWLIERFTRAKAQMSEDLVNAKFSLVSWSLFKDQLNGGLEERCDAVYNSQPWYDLSTSEKIKCGVDIINTLTNHFGVSVPVWVDNRESCTDLPDTGLQVISLIVSPEDKALRVEKVEKELAVA